MTETQPTDPTGRSFVSYSRRRLQSVSDLIRVQHELGIPTWQDVEDLDEVQIEPELRRVLKDPATANSILWITPEVATSPTIRDVEVPLIVQRERRRDAFFLIPVAAGGLNHDSAADLVNDRLGAEDLSTWNFRRVLHDPPEPEEIRSIAERVLVRRVAAVHQTLPPDEPIRLQLRTWHRAASGTGWAAVVDWIHRFQGRHAEPGAWDSVLLPALVTLRETFRRRAPGRGIEASGYCSLTAGLALGRTFLSTDEIDLSWRQVAQGYPDQSWSLAASGDVVPVTAETVAARTEGTGLAILLSITEDVEPAFGAFRDSLPTIRATVRVRIPGSSFQPFRITNPGQAAALTELIVAEVRRARGQYRCKDVHMFGAIPVGLAVLLGRQLNTLGPVQTYEHVESDTVGTYRPELLLRPDDF